VRRAGPQDHHAHGDRRGSWRFTGRDIWWRQGRRHRFGDWRRRWGRDDSLPRTSEDHTQQWPGNVDSHYRTVTVEASSCGEASWFSLSTQCSESKGENLCLQSQRKTERKFTTKTGDLGSRLFSLTAGRSQPTTGIRTCSSFSTTAFASLATTGADMAGPPKTVLVMTWIITPTTSRRWPHISTSRTPSTSATR